MRTNRILGLAIMIIAWGYSHAISYSGTLPVLHIETANRQEITSKDYYLQGTYYLDPMGAADIEAIGSKDSPLTLEIKGRGNYTWTGFDKKPYRLKLTEKAAFMGMNKSKHFALLAHADDNKGFMRNTIGFYFSEQIGMAWTPKAKPVELVLNGDYKGLYFLTETIRVDKDRVNIVEQEDNETDSENITGGWLVEIDNYRDDPQIRFMEGDTGEEMAITYKTPEELSSAQEQFLRAEMERIDRLVYGDKNSDELWQYVDMDALAKFYIVQEITDNYESFHGSCYLYRDMGEGQKWMFGPVWDFGSAFNHDKEQYLYKGREWHNHWIPEMCKFPKFMDRVKEIWQWLHYYKYDSVYDYATEFANHITEAAKNDAERWKDKGYGNRDMANRLKRIKERLQQTENWLVKQWGEGKATSVENVETGLSTDAVYYNLQGMRVENPVKGQVYIVRQGTESKKVLIQ
ncbi:MAG: CotH kinase family protein [Paludibacteraceae bacterium]|nr:CotH kinase family protein [Paludibacteraceae bacterium]